MRKQGVWSLFRNELSSIFKNRMMLISFCGVLLVPVLYTGIFLWAFWDPYNRLDTVPVAVVNEDQGATFNGEQLNVGKELVDKLKANPKFDWNFVSLDKAKKGLKDQDYYIMIRVPESFSKDATTVLDAQPKKLTLEYTPNEGFNFLASQIGESAMNVITSELSKTITETYATTLIDSLMDVKGGLKDASDGSGKLYDGSKDLNKGSKELRDNLKTYASKMLEFKSGLGQVASGSSDLKNGLTDLNDGMGQLNTAANQLSAGGNKLDSSLNTFESKMNEYKAGVHKIGDAAGSFVTGTSDLHDGIGKLSAGASILQTGLTGAVDGAKQVNDGASQLSLGLQGLKAKIPDLTQGTDHLLAGATQVSGGLTQLKLGTKNLSDGATQLRDGMSQFDAALQALLSTSSLPDAQKTQIQATYSQLLQGATSVATGAGAIDTNTGALSTGATQVTGGLTAMKNSETDLVNGVNALSAGADGLSVGAGKLYAGQQQLLGGSTLLTTNFKTAVDGSKQLADGAQAFGVGAKSITDATDQLADATSQLHGGSTELSGGLKLFTEKFQEAAAGANKLQAGSIQLAGGMGKLQSANNQLTDAAGKLSAGSTELAAGTSKLEDGAKTLHAELQKGSVELSDNMKNIKSSDSNAKMVAAPVNMEKTSFRTVPNYGTGFSPYFLSLGLFVGALLMSIVFPFKESVGEPRNGFTWFASKFGVLLFAGFIQAIFAVLFELLILGLEVKSLGLFFVAAWIGSFAFLALIQMLVTLFGDPGRFIAIILLILQLASSAGTFPVETIPGFLQHVNPLLPMTYTVFSFKAVISTGDYSFLFKNLMILLGYVVVCGTVTTLFFQTQCKKLYSKHTNATIEA